jgi:GTP-binding protein
VSRVSAAKPKIGDYPFTTLQPTLGIARVDGERTFVIADLPGLVPGASEGRGLGHQFLRHTERTRLLLHMLDLDPSSGREPLEDLAVIDAELAAYSPELAARPQLVVANKTDVADGDPAAAAALERVRRHCAATGRPFHAISAATGRGLGELLHDVADRLADLPWAPAAS